MMEFQLSYFKILKDDAVKVLHSVCQQTWKTRKWPRLKKVSFISVPKKGNAKECSNYHTITLISQASKGSKFSTWGFTSMWTMNYQMFKLDLEKAEEWEIKLPTSTGSLKKQENYRKTVYFCFIDYAKSFECVDHKKLGNS